MNLLSIKTLCFIILFIPFFAIVIFANSSYFCSKIACNSNSECHDNCDGGYWYYGNGTCSSDCCLPDNKHCKYENKTCADSDASDGFPKINCNVRNCTAECDQDTDCLCPTDECINQDYYDYPEYGVCNESCECYCEPNILVNDTRCAECEDNDADSYYNYTISCPEGDDCDDSNADINPGANESCFDGIDNDCDTEIDLNDTDCYGCVDNDEDGYYTYSVNCTEGNDCDDSDPNVNPGTVEVCDDGIDNNCNDEIDCDDASCVNHPNCIQPSPQPTPSGGGGLILGGGIVTVKKIVCGDGDCNYTETCSNCPEDCLKEGEICCNNITYEGNCCVDADCGEGYECNITKYCNSLYFKEEIIQPEICEEDWMCTEWSECENDIQTRKCVDKNGCGSTINKPIGVEECTIEYPPITGLLTLVTSPIGFIPLIVLIFLILFFWRRKKH